MSPEKSTNQSEVVVEGEVQAPVVSSEDVKAYLVGGAETAEEEDPRLSFRPGVMSFCKGPLTEENRQFAQVYQTRDGRYAVLTDWPDNNAGGYNPDAAAEGSSVFTTLEEANANLLAYAKTNRLPRAGQGYAEYEGFDK
ncbi:MAG: hypothetical protein KBD24_02505 [Candidatus Pacebacteria bacterium]|nr:hypothetical protein [Candidatus Paceibacterota bacterium]